MQYLVLTTLYSWTVLAIFMRLLHLQDMSYTCNRCGKVVGDHDYTTHVIKHAFQDWDEDHLLN